MPLSLQLWIIFAGITLGISLLFILLVPGTLRSFFQREIFLTIENAQISIMRGQWYAPNEHWSERDVQQQNNRTVNHFVLFPNGKLVPGRKTNPFVPYMAEDAKRQTEAIKRYSKKIGDDTIFYVIRKKEIAGQRMYLVSYMWGSYQTELVRALYARLLVVIVLLLIISWIPSIWLAKFVSNPLVRMSRHVKRIADRNWKERIVTDREDEIGQLAHSIEKMREQLVRQDEAQQSYLQHISHELKTPVMVIRSYIQSIRDGIFPKGDLQGTLEVIDDEAVRLEQLIRNLLYLTKLDYISVQEPKQESLDLKQLVEQIVERLRWQRPELEWSVKLEAVTITGDPEQWSTAIENLLDNQIRFAERRVAVMMRTLPGDLAEVRVGNDGPPIAPEQMEHLFERFSKGDNGKYGLGLAIVKKIAEHHGAQLSVQNLDKGVAFSVKIPLGSA